MNELPKTMKAAYLIGQMQIEVREIALPIIPRGGALLKVDACGLCGSDINRIKFTESNEQRVIGHEVAGVVVAVDDDSCQFQVGDRIAVGHVHIPCGHCSYCRQGSPAMCHQFKKSHISPGGYAEYISLTADHLAHTCVRIPDGVTFAQATFLDPVACCLRGLQQVKAAPFDHIAIIGAGIMGQIFVQLLKDMGCHSYLFDISDARLEIGKEYGANHVFNSRDLSVFSKLPELTGGRGADSVILTFLTQELLDASMSYSRDGAKLCMFAPPIREHELKLNFFDFFRREMHMMGSYSSSVNDLETTMNYIASKRVNVESMITQYSDLDGMLSAVRNLDDKQLKVIIRP
ncbi:MAG: alcohol dehydrogenase catalytic domain-containing protein [Anaerolineaceae bacterium]|nr:alcohol dehydrogenase catalytic domain-containing protein [Anaerolineaceae bacterium]